MTSALIFCPKLLIFIPVRAIIEIVANVLKADKRAAIVRALCEGNSARATARLVDVSYDSVAKLNLDLGDACVRFGRNSK